METLSQAVASLLEESHAAHAPTPSVPKLKLQRRIFIVYSDAAAVAAAAAAAADSPLHRGSESP